jgi:FkbM family methyltransferase
MTELINRIVSNPLGRIAYYFARPFVHLARRTANPDIPNTHIITKVQYADRTLSIRHRRWNDCDLMAIRQCFKERQYDLPTGPQGVTLQQVYDGIIASGRQPLIVDCGANIGASVAWFAARYPQAHIIAIEPAPENFKLLSLNTVGLDVDLHEAGIAPTDGPAHLKLGGDMGHRTNNDKEGIPIQMISLPTLLLDKPSSRYTPFLIKIDIEGAEQPLFSGDTSSFDLFPLIILEPHDWMIPGGLISQPFFRFHASADREFCMNHENVASIALHPLVLPLPRSNAEAGATHSS